MKLDYINTYLVGKFMYKVYHEIIPAIFDDFFKYNYHIHDHYTRTAVLPQLQPANQVKTHVISNVYFRLSQRPDDDGKCWKK